MYEKEIQRIRDEKWDIYFSNSCLKHRLELNKVIAQCIRETNAQNIEGDGGHGRGLMQIDDRSHGEWLEANDGGMNPETNIDYACQMMRGLTDYFKGDYHKALAAYNCGAGNVNKDIREHLPDEFRTAHHNYATSVLEIAEQIKPLLEGRDIPDESN